VYWYRLCYEAQCPKLDWRLAPGLHWRRLYVLGIIDWRRLGGCLYARALAGGTCTGINKGFDGAAYARVSAKSFAASLMPTVGAFAAFAAVASYLAFSVVLTSITFHFALYQPDADLTEYRHSSKEVMKYTSGSHRICRAHA